MSKVDAMRAIKDARRAAASAGAVTAPPRTAGRAAARAVATSAPPPGAAAEEAAAGEPATGPALCGHRNLGGRSCTRESDHVKNGTKSHRYG